MSRFRVLIIAIVCLLAGGMVGHLVGQVRSGLFLKSYMLDANANWLAQHIHRLSLLRTDRVQAGAEHIESTLNNSILQLAGGGKDRHGHFDPHALPNAHLQALQVARVYMDAGFEGAFSEESQQILRAVDLPPTDAEYCSPALQEMRRWAEESISQTDQDKL